MKTQIFRVHPDSLITKGSDRGTPVWERLAKSESRYKRDVLVIAPTQSAARYCTNNLLLSNRIVRQLRDLGSYRAKHIILYLPSRMDHSEGCPERIALKCLDTFGFEGRLTIVDDVSFVPNSAQEAALAPVESPAEAAVHLQVRMSASQPISKKKWDGTGKPPAGEQVEYRRPPHTRWIPAQILFVGERRYFFRDNDGNELTRNHGEIELRPRRTLAELAAEVRTDGIAAIMTDAGITESAFVDDPEAEAWAAALYDKGYSKGGTAQ